MGCSLRIRGSASESWSATVCLFIASGLLFTGSSTASSLGQTQASEKEMRSVKLLKFNYLIFFIGLSLHCIYSKLLTEFEGQNSGEFRSMAAVRLSSLLEVPTLSVCQMVLLYCQWHTFWGLWCVSVSPLYSGSIWCSITPGYLKKKKKMLVTSEGCPYPCCYNCPRTAFQTLPTSPLSSMLQLLTSHPDKINNLTMHNMECHSPVTDIDRHSKPLVQMTMMRRLANWQNCWANQGVVVSICMETSWWIAVIQNSCRVWRSEVTLFCCLQHLDLLKHPCNLSALYWWRQDSRGWTQSLWQVQHPFSLESHGNQLWNWTCA